MPSFGDSHKAKCSFCHKTENEVYKKLIASPFQQGTYICDECVSVCNEILSDEAYEQESSTGTGPIALPKPIEIKESLDAYVIGQEQAKKILSVAVYNHYKRLNFGKDSEIEVDKSNILLIGPTGTGKTLLAQTLARILNVPFAITDATTLTEAGYVGEDVENIILKLVQAADGDIERAETGIIYIDEIDKITRKSENPSLTRDVSGEGVQQALLKIIEGKMASVPPQGGRKHPHQELLQVDTTKILFICGGTFVGIEKIIQARVASHAMGFGSVFQGKENRNVYDLLRQVEPKDLIKFGFIPEFVGRLPVVAALHDLDEATLIQILTQPKNALVKQYSQMLEYEGVKLSIEEEALTAIVREVIKRETGARGLRAVMERIMIDVMYEIPTLEGVKECIVTAENVIQGKPPVLVYEEKEQKALSA